ncbi:MetQ/NlpA family ABC transporter substrate-binding protein [Shigella flexneri]
MGLLPTALDITENPKNLKIVELEAPQLPRSWTMRKLLWPLSTPLRQPDQPDPGERRYLR